MTLQMIIQRDVDTAQPGESAQAAAQRMRTRNVGMLVVVDARSHPIGVLTDRDIAVSVVAAGTDPNLVQVLEIMTPDPTCIADDRNTDEALAVMQRRGVRRLPVVNARGLLVGVVSMDDMLQTVAERLAAISRVIDTSSPRRLAMGEEEPVARPAKVVRPKPAPAKPVQNPARAKAAGKRAQKRRTVST